MQADVSDATSGEVVSVTLHGTNTPQRTREAVRHRSKFSAVAWPDTSVPHQPLRVETLAQLSCRCQMGVLLLRKMGIFAGPRPASLRIVPDHDEFFSGEASKDEGHPPIAGVVTEIRGDGAVRIKAGQREVCLSNNYRKRFAEAVDRTGGALSFQLPWRLFSCRVNWVV